MSHLRPRRVRTRLTLWYTGVLAAILALGSAAVSVLFLYELRDQLDVHAIEQLEALETKFQLLPDGAVQLPEEEHHHPYPATEETRFVEVLSAGGAVLYRNDELQGGALDDPPSPGEGQGSYSPRSVRLDGGVRVRVVSQRYPIGGQDALIRMGLSEEPMWRRLRHTMLMMLLGYPVALGLAAWGGSFLAGRALAPISALTRKAEEINAEQLHDRLPVGNPEDEIGRLAQAFNATLTRLESSFQQLRRFTADAAHELRTPLTAIRSVGEVGLSRPGDAESYRETIESMLEEVNRLGFLVEGLLAMTRADSGQFRFEPQPVCLLGLAREAAGFLSVLAEEQGQSLTIDGASVTVPADPVIVRQIVINLLDNAIKYSPAGSPIRIRVFPFHEGFAALEVEDSGPGIPAEHRPHIFERFYRVEAGRERGRGGAGLGLAIGAWGAKVHGGTLTLVSGSGGCVFRLSLPVQPPAQT